MPNLLMPNIAQTGLQGYQQGADTAANHLLGLAISNPSNAQPYLAQAAQINPGGAMLVQRYLAAQQQAQQTAQQAQQAQTVKKAGAAARYLAAAVQSNNPAQIQGAYQATYPYLSQLAQQHGTTLPQQWDPSLMPGLQQLIATTSVAFPDDNKLQTVTPGSVLTRGGQPVFNNPAAPKIVNGMAVTPGANGGMVASQIPITGTAPGTGGVNASLPGINGQGVTFDFPPGTPPEVIAAARAAAVAHGDILPNQQVTPAGGPPQTLAQTLIAAKPPSALQQKIDIARGMGATPDQIKGMVLGANGADLGGGVLPGDPNLTGDAYFASIKSPGLRNMLVGISEGKQGIPRMYRNKDGTSYTTTQIQQMVSQGDPTFSMANLPTRIATRKDFTVGQDAKTLTNLAQASAHIQQLVPLISKLAGHSFLPNAPINAIEDRVTGDVTSWKTKADAVAHEARAVFAGAGGGTLEELNQYLANLSPNASIPQKQAAVQGLAELLASRLNIMKSKYVQAMGRDDMGFNVNYGAPTLQAVAAMSPAQIGFAPIQTTAAQARSTVVSPDQLGGSQLTSPTSAPSGVDSLLSKYGVQ